MIIILIIINAFVSSQIFFKKLMNPVPFKQFGSVFYRSQFPQLSAPSIVFAQAEWYGSFRAGVVSDNGDTALRSHNSRWGVRGSNEISDGLRGVYRYEAHLDLRSATLLDKNRLSFVGLSGGFGTLTMGRVWGAEYNTTGVIVDNSYFHGNNYGSYRIGPALSYAVDAGPVSMQLDAVMEGRKEQTVNSAFVATGITSGTNVGCGPATATDDTPAATANSTCIKNRISRGNAANAPAPAAAGTTNPPFGIARDVNVKTIDRILFGLSANFGSGKVAVSYDSNTTVDKDVVVPTTGDGANVVPDVKKTNLTVAGEYTFGATRVYLGYSQFKEAGDYGVAANTQERKTTNIFAGVGGSVGDTGLSYLVQAVQRKQQIGGAEAAGTKRTPILLTVAYSLGGSSTVILEGVTNDKAVGDNGTFGTEKQKSKVGLYLKVDF